MGREARPVGAGNFLADNRQSNNLVCQRGFVLAVFEPHDVVDDGRRAAQLAQTHGTLSAVVLAVHDDLEESLADGQPQPRDPRHVHGSRQVGVVQALDELEAARVRFGKAALDFVKRFRHAHFRGDVERPGEEQRQEAALHAAYVVQPRAYVLVLSGGRMRADGFENASVGPLLMEVQVPERLEIHGAMIRPKRTITAIGVS